LTWRFQQDLRFTPEPQTNPTTVIPPAWTLTLDDTRDYLVSLPNVARTDPLTIVGGRNVRLVGGEIHITADGTRALYLKGQARSVYVEGLKITGSYIGDAIALDQANRARVTLQNISVEGIRGTYEGYHADLVQTWNGPRRLEIDCFSGKSGYQGFFLAPMQFGTVPPELVDISRVQLDMPDGNYALWRDTVFPVYASEVWVNTPKTRDLFLWPKGDPVWAAVKQGVPPAPFVSADVGIGYQSKWAV
jgi:hypothetical protein